METFYFNFHKYTIFQKKKQLLVLLAIDFYLFIYLIFVSTESGNQV